jgi:hypothetical protein
LNSIAKIESLISRENLNLRLLSTSLCLSISILTLLSSSLGSFILKLLVFFVTIKRLLKIHCLFLSLDFNMIHGSLSDISITYESVKRNNLIRMNSLAFGNLFILIIVKIVSIFGYQNILEFILKETFLVI